jgi:8-oxo-dGTP diphosphatase
MEETGMEIKNVSFLAATNDIFETGKHYISIWVSADWLKNEPTITEPDKWIDQEWRDFQTLPSPLFEPCWQNLRKAKPELFK